MQDKKHDHQIRVSIVTMLIKRLTPFFRPVFYLLVLLWPMALMAAEPPVATAAQKQKRVVYVPAPVNHKPEPFLQSLEPYKPITVLNTWFLGGEGADQGYLDQELKLTFSFKRHIHWNLYFAYSHKAFWQIYDAGNSRPFREHNYNPEFFLEWDNELRFDHIRLGLIEHESNGEKLRYSATADPVNFSRTWNRVYVYGRKSVHSLVNLGIKFWIVTDSDDPEDGSFIVDNSDIQQYMGNGEFYAELGRSPYIISVMLRQGWKSGTETIQLDGRFPLSELTGWTDKGIDVFVQLFAGYGDSLIDYDRKIKRLSFGVAFR